jgi:hypothetical protein
LKKVREILHNFSITNARAYEARVFSFFWEIGFYCIFIQFSSQGFIGISSLYLEGFYCLAHISDKSLTTMGAPV